MLKKQGGENRATKVVICCCRCCFWCLDKCIKFINKNAYIMIVLTRGSFVPSAKKAFGLVLTNIARVGALNMLGTGFMLIGKILTAAVPAAVTYVVLTKTDRYANPESEDAVANPMAPSLLVFFIGYVVGSLTMEVWDMSTDTMLLCFCYNEKYGVIDAADVTALTELNKDAEKSGFGIRSSNSLTAVPANPTTGGQVSYQ
jgi:hypothetical protein